MPQEFSKSYTGSVEIDPDTAQEIPNEVMFTLYNSIFTTSQYMAECQTHT